MLDSSDDAGGEIILFDLVNTAAVSNEKLLGMSFEPASDFDQLRDEPAELFNLPGPGEELIVVLPAPLPGKTIE